MREVHGKDLGVAGCDYVARGETARDAVDDMIAHLEDEHDIDMPDAGVIMENYRGEGTLVEALQEAFTGEPSKEQRLIIQRLREALDISEEEIA